LKKNIFFGSGNDLKNIMNSGIYTILTIPVFTILYVYTAIGVSLVIILSWLKVKKPIYFMFRIWAKSVFLMMGKRLEVSGKENLNRDEKYILLANHASLFDIVAITTFYPNIAWFGHERLLKVPIFGKFLKMIGYVPFKEPSITNTRHMLEQLMDKANDQSVALFPEGTRTLNGRINPFFRGFIYLFRTREIDILPVTLTGFYDLKPKNRFYINFGSKLKVKIHKPIPREELIDKSDREIIDTVKTVIESAYY
jgi:1-acyl-sn-glycerol-3-phosphate acyltransferase